MSVKDCKLGTVIIAGGSSCSMGEFDPMIMTIIERFNVKLHKSLIFSHEWSKEGDAPHSQLWLFDDKPERACEDMLIACKETVKNNGDLDFVVIDRRGIDVPVKAYTDMDVEHLHSMAKDLNVMVIFIPNIKDKDLNLDLFTEEYSFFVGLNRGNKTLDNLCEEVGINRERIRDIEAKTLKKLRKNK